MKQPALIQNQHTQLAMLQRQLEAHQRQAAAAAQEMYQRKHSLEHYDQNLDDQESQGKSDSYNHTDEESSDEDHNGHQKLDSKESMDESDEQEDDDDNQSLPSDSDFNTMAHHKREQIMA